ncbi:MAG: T9SS type A sorting domain-containing protein [Bacteroidales bacterium]|nr:T9SS type A sorting domain-containing protein [Bacteroidales bacterium]
MKRRFLPISLLLTIIILAQTSFVVVANGDSGKYNPRSTAQTTAQSFMKSIRANQETGLIDPAWLVSNEGTQTREGLNWTSLGPDNYGSLTRGIIYDKSDASNKTIYIGTMGGGIFKSTNGGITWKTVSDNLMVSCMVQAEDGTIYVGTGDGRGAHNHNGLSNLNYENSFVGTGIYKFDGSSLTQIENTSVFVNDLAVAGNKVYAATNEGLKYYEGETWTTLIEGEAYGVEACGDNDIIAVVGYEVYMSNEEGGFDIITTGEENMLPATETYKMIAVAPSDHNYIYVAYLTASNGTGNIYFTSDHGATWQVVYTASTIYDIFGNRGLIDNAIAVYPNNPRKVLIGGTNLWVLRDELGEGIFRLECISNGNAFQIAQSGGAFYYNYTYIHLGIQSIAFNPDNVNEFFVGSEGGIFKGTCSEATGYLFEGANRYFITAEEHTSVARMFSVGFSGELDMTLGGSLDHGTIHVYGDATTNNVTTGNAIYPNDIATTNAAETYGPFDYSKVGGPCAISTINPQVMFVTATGSNAVGTPLMRTQTAGDDYDKDNFSYSVTDETASIANTDAFRTPIALFENYNDTKSEELSKYINNDSVAIPAGETIQVKSNNCSYPFDYVLTEELLPGDSIEVQDIISSTFLVAVKNAVYMTRDALVFNKVSDWWKIGTISGIPNAVTISSDGDVAYVGTIAGKLYKAVGLTDATNADNALGIDAIQGVDGTDSIAAVPGVITFEELVIDSIFNGQAITSIAINPNNSDDFIVTLGNYGNENYVFRSNDGGASFSAKQGNLPAKPVYSSLIEKTTGKIFLGTEDGVYVSEDMNSWTNAGIAGVPVMDIKQQLQENHGDRYEYLVDEIGEVTTITYPGIFNEGMIYIATYGRGLYRCDEYHVEYTELNVEDVTMTETFGIEIYPNPIVSEATINFNVKANANVSYQIYDLSGRMIVNNVLGTYTEGYHKATFNVDGLSSGSYIIKVQAGTESHTAKIIVY